MVARMKFRALVQWWKLRLTVKYWWLLLVRFLVLGQFPWDRPWEAEVDEEMLDE